MGVGRVLPRRGPRIAAKARGLRGPPGVRGSGQRPQRGELPHERAVADAGARRSAMKARRSSGCSAARSATVRRLAVGSARKGGELAEIARIGLERLRREPALGAEVGEPVLAKAARQSFIERRRARMAHARARGRPGGDWHGCLSGARNRCSTRQAEPPHGPSRRTHRLSRPAHRRGADPARARPGLQLRRAAGS